jgi:hypothetical protein
MDQVATSTALPRPSLNFDVERLFQAALLRHMTLADLLRQ